MIMSPPMTPHLLEGDSSLDTFGHPVLSDIGTDVIVACFCLASYSAGRVIAVT